MTFEEYLFENKGKKLGIYVPIRALNTLYCFKNLIEELSIELLFYDDTDSLSYKYLPGFNIPIKSGKEIVQENLDSILIYSYTFGNSIKEKLKAIKFKVQEIHIITCKELFEVLV